MQGSKRKDGVGAPATDGSSLPGQLLKLGTQLGTSIFSQIFSQFTGSQSSSQGDPPRSQHTGATQPRQSQQYDASQNITNPFGPNGLSAELQLDSQPVLGPVHTRETFPGFDTQPKKEAAKVGLQDANGSLENGQRIAGDQPGPSNAAEPKAPTRLRDLKPDWAAVRFLGTALDRQARNGGRKRRSQDKMASLPAKRQRLAAPNPEMKQLQPAKLDVAPGGTHSQLTQRTAPALGSAPQQLGSLVADHYQLVRGAWAYNQYLDIGYLSSKPSQRAVPTGTAAVAPRRKSVSFGQASYLDAPQLTRVQPKESDVTDNDKLLTKGMREFIEKASRERKKAERAAVEEAKKRIAAGFPLMRDDVKRQRKGDQPTCDARQAGTQQVAAQRPQTDAATSEAPRVQPAKTPAKTPAKPATGKKRYNSFRADLSLDQVVNVKTPISNAVLPEIHVTLAATPASPLPAPTTTTDPSSDEEQRAHQVGQLFTSQDSQAEPQQPKFGAPTPLQPQSQEMNPVSAPFSNPLPPSSTAFPNLFSAPAEKPAKKQPEAPQSQSQPRATLGFSFGSPTPGAAPAATSGFGGFGAQTFPPQEPNTKPQGTQPATQVDSSATQAPSNPPAVLSVPSQDTKLAATTVRKAPPTAAEPSSFSTALGFSATPTVSQPPPTALGSPIPHPAVLANQSDPAQKAAANVAGGATQPEKAAGSGDGIARNLFGNAAIGNATAGSQTTGASQTLGAQTFMFGKPLAPPTGGTSKQSGEGDDKREQQGTAAVEPYMSKGSATGRMAGIKPLGGAPQLNPQQPAFPGLLDVAKGAAVGSKRLQQPDAKPEAKSPVLLSMATSSGMPLNPDGGQQAGSSLAPGSFMGARAAWGDGKRARGDDVEGEKGLEQTEEKANEAPSKQMTLGQGGVSLLGKRDTEEPEQSAKRSRNGVLGGGDIAVGPGDGAKGGGEGIKFTMPAIGDKSSPSSNFSLPFVVSPPTPKSQTPVATQPPPAKPHDPAPEPRVAWISTPLWGAPNVGQKQQGVADAAPGSAGAKGLGQSGPSGEGNQTKEQNKASAPFTWPATAPSQPLPLGIPIKSSGTNSQGQAPAPASSQATQTNPFNFSVKPPLGSKPQGVFGGFVGASAGTQAQGSRPQAGLSPIMEDPIPLQGSDTAMSVDMPNSNSPVKASISGAAASLFPTSQLPPPSSNPFNFSSTPQFSTQTSFNFGAQAKPTTGFTFGATNPHSQSSQTQPSLFGHTAQANPVVIPAFGQNPTPTPTPAPAPVLPPVVAPAPPNPAPALVANPLGPFGGSQGAGTNPFGSQPAALFGTQQPPFQATGFGSQGFGQPQQQQTQPSFGGFGLAGQGQQQPPVFGGGGVSGGNPFGNTIGGGQGVASGSQPGISFVAPGEQGGFQMGTADPTKPRNIKRYKKRTAR